MRPGCRPPPSAAEGQLVRRATSPDSRTIRHDIEHRTGTLAPRNLILVTNSIESTFATVRHRTIRSKGCLSNRTALAMVSKLLEAAQKS